MLEKNKKKNISLSEYKKVILGMESAAADYTVWYVLGVLGLIYLIILFRNKKGRRRRKSRKFMDGKRKHGRNN